MTLVTRYVKVNMLVMDAFLLEWRFGLCDVIGRITHKTARCGHDSPGRGRSDVDNWEAHLVDPGIHDVSNVHAITDFLL